MTPFGVSEPIALALSPRPSRKIQILACGNTLRGDDGVGWHIARMLEAHPPCEGVRVTYAPQLLPEHADLVNSAEKVIFIDCSAIIAAGTIAISLVKPSAVPPSLFTHHLDPATLLRLARDVYGHAAADAMLLTVGAESFELKEELSGSVSAAIPEVLAAVQFHARS